MNKRHLSFIILAIFFLFFPSPCIGEEAEGKGEGIELKGYATTLWLFLNDTINDHTLNTNRLRLDGDIHCNKNASIRLVNDLEAFTGNFVSTPTFETVKNNQLFSYWNLSWGASYGENVYFRHSLYRAYLHYETNTIRAIAGKQRIAWGVMRFWRPTDLFNPVSPLQIESGERTGVDALAAYVPFSGASGFEAVYAPSRYVDDDMSAGKFNFTTGDYDITFVGGRARGNDILGLTFDGYVGDGGFRGEALKIDPPAGDPYCQWTIGADYTFPGPLTLTTEYFYNGGAGGTPVNPFFYNQGFLQTKNSHFLGLGAQYRLSPLIDLNLFSTYDFDGKSIAVAPRIRWDLRQNVDFDMGYTFFTGDESGEYEGYPNILFSQLKIYF